MTKVTVRVYGPLNDFLASQRRQVTWPQGVVDHPSVKDVIEIDLILVNGTSVSFDYLVQNGDRISAFPRFTTLDIGMLTRVRPPPLDSVCFVADVHLGRLARYLRLAGLDTAYREGADDREGRILLTRDLGLLKRRKVAHGYFVRETHSHRQFVEVLRRFGPLDLQPFARCLRCNEVLRAVPKSVVDAALLPRTRQYYDHFYTCGRCGRVYWKGSHWKRLKRTLEATREEAERRPI